MAGNGAPGKAMETGIGTVHDTMNASPRDRIFGPKNWLKNSSFDDPASQRTTKNPGSGCAAK
jgi:hypothetical protein